jgi:hypothetical protein
MGGGSPSKTDELLAATYFELSTTPPPWRRRRRGLITGNIYIPLFHSTGWGFIALFNLFLYLNWFLWITLASSMLLATKVIYTYTVMPHSISPIHALCLFSHLIL